MAASIQVRVMRGKGQPVLLPGLWQLVRGCLDVQRELAELRGHDVEAAELRDLPDAHGQPRVSRLGFQPQEFWPNAELELAPLECPAGGAHDALAGDRQVLCVER